MMVTVQETVGRWVRFVKPAKFDYLRAENIDQVVEALDQGDGEAIVLAGGQTLMPMLAMRLARPAMVVDTRAVPIAVIPSVPAQDARNVAPHTFSNAGSNVFSFLLVARKQRGRSGDHWSRIFHQKYPFCILPAPHGIQKKYRHVPEVFQLEKVFVFRHQ